MPKRLTREEFEAHQKLRNEIKAGLRPNYIFYEGNRDSFIDMKKLNQSEEKANGTSK